MTMCTDHGVSHEQTGDVRVLLLHPLHMLDHILHICVKGLHVHTLTLTPAMANWGREEGCLEYSHMSYISLAFLWTEGWERETLETNSQTNFIVTNTHYNHMYNQLHTRVLAKWTTTHCTQHTYHDRGQTSGHHSQPRTLPASRNVPCTLPHHDRGIAYP